MARKPLTEEEVLAQLPAADEATRLAMETEPLAQRASYNKETGLIDVELRGECVFSFPPKKLQGLRDASISDLKKVEVTPMGDGLHWGTLDVDLSIASLLRLAFGQKAWMYEWAQAEGSKASAYNHQTSKKPVFKIGLSRAKFEETLRSQNTQRHPKTIEND
jgi:hypothetical protein